MAEKGKLDLQAIAPHACEKLLVVYTDGACSGNGQTNAVAGSGVYFGPGDRRNAALDLPEGAHTNQRAELFALLWSLQYAHRHGARLQRFVVRSDSTYCVRGWNEWLPKWVEREWLNSTGNAVANQDLWRQVHELREIQLPEAGVEVVLEWVKGHSNDPGNEAADALAREARDRCKFRRRGVSVPAKKRVRVEEADDVRGGLDGEIAGLVAELERVSDQRKALQRRERAIKKEIAVLEAGKSL